MRFESWLRAIPIAAILTGIWSAGAHAALLTYSDQATFLAATGATDATGPLPDLGLRDDGVVPGSSTTPVGSATFYAARWVMGADGVAGFDWTTLLPGHDIAISDSATGGADESLDVSFTSLVYSAGFDFSEPSLDGNVQDGCYATCVDSTFEVTLKNGAATVGSFQFNAADDTAAFVGVWSSVAFDKLEIREIVGTDDDEFYGRFFTGDVALAPEPAVLLLLGPGLAGLAAMGRARRRAGRS